MNMKYSTSHSRIHLESLKSGSYNYVIVYLDNEKFIPGNKPVASIKKAVHQLQQVLNQYPNHTWNKQNKDLNAEIYFKMLSALTEDNER
jgi:hypothetical protein